LSADPRPGRESGQPDPAQGLDTFPRLVFHHARVRPRRPAIREKDLGIWQTWTWEEAAREIRAFACGLAASGFTRGERLTIIGDNRPRLYWAMAAAQSLGGVPVPLYQDAVAEEMVYPLTQAEIRFAVVEDQEQVDKLLEVAEKCPLLRRIIYDDPRGLRNYDSAALQD
jgi:long-chain acyl-CoA synthetase